MKNKRRLGVLICGQKRLQCAQARLRFFALIAYQYLFLFQAGKVKENLMEITPITVAELNKYVKDKIAGDEFLQNVYVKGEISNFKNHYTGHMYFTLKDETSLIKCIMFKSFAERLKFMPKDGMKVVVFGTVSVYERDGVYQIYVKAMKEDGLR